MIAAMVLTVAGLLLSAFFSGSETGFYRVTRVRLASDAKSGKLIAKALYWLVSRSSLVVATVLIGNNLANYLASLGLTLLAQQLFLESGQMETILPILMTPVLFIYGELLPKYLCYQVPYRLLRVGAPFMLLFTLLFAPISIFVMLLEWAWQKLVRSQSTQAVSSLERQELQRVLVEGQEAGVVLPIQRELAQNLFTFGVRPIRQFTTPLRGIPLANREATRQELLDLAQATGSSLIGVRAEGTSKLIGCVQVGDLLTMTEATPRIVPIDTASTTESSIQVLTRLQGNRRPLAQLVDANGRVIGIVTRERLASLLLSRN